MTAGEIVPCGLENGLGRRGDQFLGTAIAEPGVARLEPSGDAPRADVSKRGQHRRHTWQRPQCFVQAVAWKPVLPFIADGEILPFFFQRCAGAAKLLLLKPPRAPI